jgi:5-formyltetrahydrofolate cyclo-ligase
MTSDIVHQKKTMRAEARMRRAGLAKACPDFPARIACYADALPIPGHARVSAYVPLEGEADPNELAQVLAGKGCEICYPRVHQKAQPLWFHVPIPGEHFVRSAFGVLEPRPDWPVAIPDVLLVPMLAFDAEGYRLGYGGGFYDRTLAHIRAAKPVVAIGIAFSGLEVPSVPHDASDEKLDMLVTELDVRRFGIE